MVWWVWAIIYVATTVISYFAARAAAPKPPAPSALGEMQVPTAEEGRNIPVVFGTCLLRAPNVIWYGDYDVFPIKDGKEGYRYYLGMDLALCHGPVDAFAGIYAGTGEDLKALAHVVKPKGSSGVFPSADGIFVNDWNLFGGEEPGKEGGIYGVAKFYRGDGAQGADGYLRQNVDANYPAYRGICRLVLGCTEAESNAFGARKDYWWHGCFYLGTSPYIKNIAVAVRRCPSNLGLAAWATDISGDANPAEIVHDILTNPRWGIGIAASGIDKASFVSAAQTLAAEGLGMSLQLDSPQAADDAIGNVLNHIDGILYTDPQTGLWTLNLVRAVARDGLDSFGPDEIEECEFGRDSWENTVNAVKLTYLDRSKWKASVVEVQDTANIATRGGSVAMSEIDMSGFSTVQTAMKVAMRELAGMSYPVGRGRIRVNRKAWKWRTGTPFLLTWPPLGIDGMQMRVVNIAYGALPGGAIEAEIIEDVFGLSGTGYADPGGDVGGGWVDPVGDPQPALAQTAFEAPFQYDHSEMRFNMVGCVRADHTYDSYDVWIDTGTGTFRATTSVVFCPSGVLAAGYPRSTPANDAAGFAVSDGHDMEFIMGASAEGVARGDNLFVIVSPAGAEWCAFSSSAFVGDGAFSVSGVVRGIYDTVPIDHPAGARVWFVRVAGAWNMPHVPEWGSVIDETVTAWMLPHNPKGTVALGSVDSVATPLTGRARKPYPPGNVRVNGRSWPDGADIGAVDAVLTWAHRNRLAQPGLAVVAQDAASVGSPEGSYTVDVLVGGKVVRTQTGVTGTSYTYAYAQRQADDADLSKPVRFRIAPLDGAWAGTVRTTDPFVMR